MATVKQSSLERVHWFLLLAQPALRVAESLKAGESLVPTWLFVDQSRSRGLTCSLWRVVQSLERRLTEARSVLPGCCSVACFLAQSDAIDTTHPCQGLPWRQIACLFFTVLAASSLPPIPDPGGLGPLWLVPPV